ncbi:acyl-CoA synthetase [Thermoflavimicrobium dichotomicum]|uniref:Acetyl-CoA synthetase n=1 Tax=Thermoflavimicrobium dichotomicum TaxID=46223 RepID=A0A1I3MT35_9BACL|nr:acyl--CoA ligase [Thermoflavimicrobium dichotomicum]SFI99866.1 acetyl-CoA synthetase [Thermoflavimicrobium dichotomicum]
MKFYNMAQDVDRHAQTNKVAIRWLNDKGERRTVTYKELKEKSDQLAKGLIERGFQLGDRMMILLPRIPEAYIAYLACLKAGLVIVPGSEMLQAGDIQYRLKHAEIKGVIAYESLVERVERAAQGLECVTHRFVQGEKKGDWIKLEEVQGKASTSLPQTKEDDIAFIAYTSGTTGGPKGAIHHHSWAIAHQKVATKQWLDIREDDVVWATAGPGWAKWVWSPFMSTLGAGATAFVYHGSFQPEKYLTLLQDERINVLCCTPTEYRMMAKTDHLERFNLSHLRSAVSAGEPLNREVLDTFKKYFGVQVRDGYGQTENTLLVGTLKDMEIRPGSMGKPVPLHRVALIDDDGNPVPVGKVGHIAVHRDSPALFKGYYRDEERTRAAYIGDWYITGDLAKQDEDGYFWFEGRSDDIIISSGYTIGPFEVEDALVKHPSVKESAVVASPDPIRGSIVKAFVVLKEQVSSSEDLIKELQEHVKAITAPYKYPREIEFVDSLPKTTSGKIRRVELRQLEKERKSKQV